MAALRRVPASGGKVNWSQVSTDIDRGALWLMPKLALIGVSIFVAISCYLIFPWFLLLLAGILLLFVIFYIIGRLLR